MLRHVDIICFTDYLMRCRY